MDNEDDVLGRTVMEIQEAILNDARKIYSEKAIDHFLHPRNAGGIEDADSFAKVTGPCGDTMYLFLKVTEGKIVEARFMTDGCASTIACGSTITELGKGKTIDEALKVSAADVIEALDGLPDSSIHCSVLAAHTLQQAVSNLLTSKKGKDRGTGS